MVGIFLYKYLKKVFSLQYIQLALVNYDMMVFQFVCRIVLFVSPILLLLMLQYLFYEEKKSLLNFYIVNFKEFKIKSDFLFNRVSIALIKL